MKKKKTSKLIAFILAFAMVVTLLPSGLLEVMAENRPDPDPIVQIQDEPKILYEETALRDQYTKVFQLTNGNQYAFVSTDPIHYETEDGWQDIDNTLQLEKDEDDNDVYTNAGNNFDVSIPKELSESPVSVSDGEHQVSFKLLQETSARQAKVNKGKSTDNKSENKIEKEAKRLAKIEQKSSEITYDSVLPDTSISYSVEPSSLKEAITIAKKVQKPVFYQYQIETDLTPTLNKDKSVVFKDADGEVCFTMPAPFMYDDAKEPVYSEDITVTLKSGEAGGYLYTLAPSYEWLTDKARKYPVTIDPTIKNANLGTLSDSFIKIGSNTTNGSSDILSIGPDTAALIQFSSLSAIAADSQVISASLNMMCWYSHNYSTKVYLYRNVSAWTESTVTGTYSGIDRSVVYDAQKIKQSEYVSFDITQLVSDWSLNKYSNNGIALMAEGQGYMYSYSKEAGSYSSNVPYFTIEYRRTDGLNITDNCQTQDMGRAGTVYVDEFSGKLSMKNTLMGFDGNVMPVNVDLQFAQNAYTRFFSTGFFTNYCPYIYGSDSSGYTLNYFNGKNYLLRYNSETQKYECDDLAFTMPTGTGYRTLQDENGMQYRFEGSGGGFLKQIVDTSQPAQPKIIVNTYGSGRLDSLTDGAGRVYRFNYTTVNGNDLISSIEFLGTGSSSLYTLKFAETTLASGNKQVTITYPDSFTVKYELDSSGRMVKVTDVDGRYCTYTYVGTTGKVASATEYAGNGTRGGSMSFTYDYLATKITYASSVIIKRFNYDGALTSVTDDAYNSVHLSYDSNNNATISAVERLSAGVIDNASFESSSGTRFSLYQSKGSTSLNVRYGEGHTGQYSMQFYSSVDSMAYAYNKLAHIGTTKAATITYSVWAKTDSTASIALMLQGNNSTWYTSTPVSTNGKWQKITYSVACSSALDYSGIQVIYYGSGNALVDDMQMYADGNESELNLIDYSNFFNSYNSWETKNASISSTSKSVGGVNVRSATMNSSLSSPSYIKERVYINGVKGQKYTMGVMGNINTLISGKNKDHWDSPPMVGLRIEAPKDGTGSSEVIANLNLFDVPTANSYYAVGRGELELPYDCSYVDVYLYSNCQNAATLLCPELIAQPLYHNPSQSTDESEPADATTPARLSNSYDSGGYMTQTAEDNGLVTKMYYNQYGNVTREQKVNGSSMIETVNTYTANGNLIDYSTDELGNKTSYSYNGTGQVSTVSQTGTGQYYSYDTMNRLKNMYSTDSTTISVSYTYEYDRIKTISQNGVIYTYNYNSFGDLANIKAGSTTLVTYNYSDNITRRISSVQYANGQTISYSYDIFGNLISQNGDYTYNYDNSGNLLGAQDNVNKTTTATVDGITKTTILGSTTPLHTYSTQNITDGYRELETMTSYNTQTDYTTDVNGAKTAATSTRGGSTYKEERWADNFGRMSNSNYTCDDNFIFRKNYTYSTPSSGKTSNQIASENYTYKYNSGVSAYGHAYTYDAVGNIKTIKKDGVLRYTYTYDANNHLTRVDDAVQNKSLQYVYNTGGNLTYIYTYAYTTGTLGSYTSYTYCGYDSTWTSKMTSFGGKSLTYDTSGNVKSYDGNTYTWKDGRQLSAMTTNTGKTLSFTYDADGMRASKTVNGGKMQYFYRDGKLTGQEGVASVNSLIFHYNEDGELMSCHSNYYGKEYFYIKNIMGDILAMVDKDGNVVVEYTYDAWGKLISTTGSMASTLGVANPFRYRGYFYDTETGLYYLQSRYYNPEWCRFINADSTDMLSMAQKDILGANLFAYAANNPVNRYDPTGYWHLDLRADIVAVTIDLLIYLIPALPAVQKVLKGLKYVPKHAIKTALSGIKAFLIKVLPKLNIGLGIVGKLTSWLSDVTGLFPFGASIGGLIAWGLTKVFRSWQAMQKLFVWFGPMVKVTYFRVF